MLLEGEKAKKQGQGDKERQRNREKTWPIHQSMVQQLTREGFCLSRSLNATPMGLMQSTTCR